MHTSTVSRHSVIYKLDNSIYRPDALYCLDLCRAGTMLEGSGPHEVRRKKPHSTTPVLLSATLGE